MLSFAAKPRNVRIRDGDRVSLPSQVTLIATLSPRWLFGSGAEQSRFVIHGATGVILRFNGNTGRWYFHAGTQPEPVQVTYQQSDGILLNFNGNVVTCVFAARTIDEVSDVAAALLYGLPMVLCARFSSPCVVDHIVGQTPTGAFGYEFTKLEFHVPLVRQAEMESQAIAGLKSLALLGMFEHRRIHAALVYFHRAERLLDAGNTPWEFMAESVLNLAKVLESLFPGAKSRDAVRQGLGQYGYSEDDIETWFVPALAMRSHLDVAHVQLSLLDEEQVETLILYVEKASSRFRGLLIRVVDDALAGTSHIPVYEQATLEGSALKSLTQLTARLKVKTRATSAEQD